MNYLSICSGIEAASVAWQPLGMRAAAYAEIDPFASAVLQHRHPGIRNLGDFTKISADDVGAVDVLVGGTPCQSFSIAGLRGGLADDRGNLALEFLRLAQRLRPRWLVWENVPGVLSSDGGRDFGAILGGMVECGYGFCYRVLDAQYFGLAQRRKRVFVVGHLGDWRRAAAVLLERASLSWNPSPRSKAGQDIAGTLAAGAHPSGFNGRDAERGNIVTHALRAEGFDAGEDGTGRGIPLTVAFDTTQITSKANRCNPKAGDACHPLAAGAHAPAVAFQSSQSGVRTGDAHATLDGNNGSRRHNGVMAGSSVRRLTPRECERLQGFPDDYTQVPYRGKPAADGPRYRALGNSMAVPVMAWIGRGLLEMEAA
jgi:DNA (cytosine-5)-methyltransferase 1